MSVRIDPEQRFACSQRAELEHPGQSRWRLRALRLQLLAHFHGLAPSRGRVNVKALKRQRLDINDPELRPIVAHYLRSTLETLGAHHRAISARHCWRRRTCQILETRRWSEC